MDSDFEAVFARYVRFVGLRLWCLGFCILVSGCAPAIAPYSQHAYELAIDLKVDSLRLMDAAETPFAGSSKKVNTLRIRMEKAYEFAAGRPKNEYSTEQWRRMNDPERNLLEGFLIRWEEESSLGSTFIVESKKLVAESFDAIIQLESGKIGGTDGQ